MKSKVVNAVIISRHSFGEADRVLLAYSQELGKIKIIAKGSRKIKSKMACHIEPFTSGKYHLVEGKTFYILTGAENTCCNEQITTQISLFKDASYLCELVELTTHESEPDENLFLLLNQSLKLIKSVQPDLREILIRYFEFQLLNVLGYQPNYQKCFKCGQKITERAYYFGDFEGFCCNNCEIIGKKISKKTLKVLRLFRSKTMEEILAIRGIDSCNQELREVISVYLYDILPRSPKSYDF